MSTAHQDEMVQHPAHYNQFTQEVIDTILEWVEGYGDPQLGYLLGTTLKYIARGPYKNNLVQDMNKANFYWERFLKRVNEHSNNEVKEGESKGVSKLLKLSTEEIRELNEKLAKQEVTH